MALGRSWLFNWRIMDRHWYWGREMSKNFEKFSYYVKRDRKSGLKPTQINKNNNETNNNAEPTTLIVPTDVGISADCKKFIAEAKSTFGTIDVLINNAGASMKMAFSDMKENDMESVFEQSMRVNYLGSVYTTHHALPTLIESKGLIVAVSSWQGFQPFPNSSAYNASKHAMNGFFNCLRMELMESGSGVDVLLVCPGPVDTAIATRRLLVSNEQQSHSGMSAHECARQIIESMADRDRELVMEFRGKLIKFLGALFPSMVDRIVLSKAKKYEKEQQ